MVRCKASEESLGCVLGTRQCRSSLIGAGLARESPCLAFWVFELRSLEIAHTRTNLLNENLTWPLEEDLSHHEPGLRGDN